MSRVVVLRWPSRTAALVEKRLGGARLLSSLGPGITDLPADWTASRPEVRLLIDGALFRPTRVEGLGATEAGEAAKYSVEPTLPLPLSQLAVSCAEVSRRGSSRQILVTAVPSSRLDEALAWSSSVSPIIPAWVGTAPEALNRLAAQSSSERPVRGSTWSARVAESRWISIQSDAPGEEAKAGGGTTPDGVQVALEDEILAAARARGGGYPRGTTETGPRRRAPAAPIVLALLAFVLLAASFGLRAFAAQARIADAEAKIGERAARALPGGRIVAPVEQVQGALAAASRAHAAFRERIAKTGSALDWLEILDAGVDSGGLVIDDLRIAPEEISVIGSASSLETVEALVSRLRQPSIPAVPYIVSDPEIRRSPAGLGVDFVIRGRRERSAS